MSAKFGEWLPIETVPGRGNGPQMVWVDTDDGGEPMILYRDTSGNWLYDGDPFFSHAFYLKATHWMPLPPPPKTKE